MDFPKRTVLGYTITLLCVVSWVASSAAVQLLNRQVPDFQLAILRYIGIFMFASIPLIATRAKPVVPRESLVHLIMMGCCTMVFNILYFYAVAILPLSHMSFMAVCKMIIMMVASRLLLHEVHNIIISISIIGCIIGTIFLIQPWSGFTQGFLTNLTMELAVATNGNSTLLTNETLPGHPELPSGISQIAFGYIALVLAAVFEVFFILLGGIYLKNVQPTVLIFLTSAMAVPVILACCLYVENPLIIPNMYTMVLVAVHAAASGIGLLCLIAACVYITPAQVTIICTMETVLYLILQYTMFSTTLYGHRNVLEVIGCLLITISVMLSALNNNVEKHEDF